ncbi:MAG TPA: hypothetical protein VGG12_09530, partial [Methylovirgula sp.]
AKHALAGRAKKKAWSVGFRVRLRALHIAGVPTQRMVVLALPLARALMPLWSFLPPAVALEFARFVPALAFTSEFALPRPVLTPTLALAPVPLVPFVAANAAGTMAKERAKARAVDLVLIMESPVSFLRSRAMCGPADRSKARNDLFILERPLRSADF